MENKWLFISIILTVFIFSGCAGLSDKERTELTAASIELRNELIKRDASLTYNQKMVAEKKAEVAELEEENATLSNKVKELSEKSDKKKSLNEESITEGRSVSKRADVGTGIQEKSLPLRIKVLTGAKQATKAKALSDKLTGMGYKIERVERASKPFARTTVYYAAGVTKEAKAMAKKMGASTVLKPITWRTVFNLIIAVGTAK